MKTLLVVVVIIGLLVIAGWVVFDFGDSSASVEFRTDRAREDTAEVIDRVREATPEVDVEIRDRDERPAEVVE